MLQGHPYTSSCILFTFIVFYKPYFRCLDSESMHTQTGLAEGLVKRHTELKRFTVEYYLQNYSHYMIFGTLYTDELKSLHISGIITGATTDYCTCISVTYTASYICCFITFSPSMHAHTST